MPRTVCSPLSRAWGEAGTPGQEHVIHRPQVLILEAHLQLQKGQCQGGGRGGGQIRASALCGAGGSKNRSTRRSAPRHPTAMASTAKPPDPMPYALAAALLPGCARSDAVPGIAAWAPLRVHRQARERSRTQGSLRECTHRVAEESASHLLRREVPAARRFPPRRCVLHYNRCS